MRHTIQMLAGCLLPLLLIFILPLFGVSGGTTLLLVMIALFVGHLWMMRGHGGHGGGGCGMGHRHGNHNNHALQTAAAERDGANRRSKGSGHEHHQH